jgi:PilZ domain
VELIRLFGSDAATAETSSEGRRAPRLDAGEAGLNKEVKLSPGGVAELLNVSESGLLVESKQRLSTGAKVLITLTGREPKRLTGRVVRCQVCAIHRDGTMTYQTALALDQPAGLEQTIAESTAAAAAVSEPEAPREPVPVVTPAPRLVNQW